MIAGGGPPGPEEGASGLRGRRGAPGGVAVVERIVVPLDGSEAAETAVPHARALAGVFEADVRLLRVIPPGRAGGVTRDAVEWRLDRDDAARYLERWCGRLGEAGVVVTSAVLEGEPADEILSELRGGREDLVVLTSHGRSGATEYRLGGTAQKIVAGAGTSVLLVRPGAGRGEEEGSYRTVLVPVDGSRRGEWALCAAACVARVAGAKLVIAHVLASPERVRAPGTDAAAGRLEARLMERCREAAEAYVSEREERLCAPDLEVESRIVVAEQVPAAIHELADEIGADLVVVSAHGRSGSAPWPYGSVAINLLTYGRVPVFVLQDQPRTAASEEAEAGGVEHARPAFAASDTPAGAVPS